MKLEEIKKYCDKLPKIINGYNCIEEMKNSGDKHWRQMEWGGFYIQSLFDFDDLILPGKKIGNTVFDAHSLTYEHPIDIKLHSLFDHKYIKKNYIMLNDKEATLKAIEEYGKVGLFVVEGSPEYDEFGEFKLWHDNLKGEKSKYVLKNEAENKKTRIRKVIYKLEKLSYYQFDHTNIHNLSLCQEGMANSNGNLRRAKYQLNTKSATPICECVI